MKKLYPTIICASVLMLCSGVSIANEPKHPTPEKRIEHMQKMEQDLAKKLNLTEEQKAKAKQIREDGRAKMKEHHRQMEELRKQNMADFENILTPEQKENFAKIKAEHKAKVKEHKGKRGPWHRKFFQDKHKPTSAEAK
ncbi:MAG: hypothetical protein E7018_00930 [Alphaproteobacteria bacterium]|nr:hypothetical protein [Alphaproteobacteria bacterium]